MSERNCEDQKPMSSLRRSPRLHCKSQRNAQSPRTPNNTETRSGRPNSFSTPLTKIKKTSQGFSRNGGRKDTESNSEKSRNGCRRSARTKGTTNFSSSDLEKHYGRENRQMRNSVGGPRFALEKSVQGSTRSGRRYSGANVGKNDEALHLDKEYLIEKRITRSSVRRSKVVIHEVADSDSEDSSERVVILPGEREVKVGVDDLKKKVGEIQKRVTRSSSKSYVETSPPKKAVISDEIKPKGDDELSEIDKSKKGVRGCETVRRNGEQSCARKAKVGEKRKRDQAEGCEAARGWSKEQEFALQRAYFTAKPTPQFWKKVSRMVPGKSAEECFDRVHADHLTPPQPRTRSRARIKEDVSPLSFSASKLLRPTEMKTKRVAFRKRTLVAQKTVRQILHNQQKEDQDYDPDLFALLEPSFNPSPAAAFVSPKPTKSSAFCKGFNQIPRLDRSVALTSPPVLKQIRNKALHEKYIDQLHCRDAKRKAEALRNSRHIKDQIHLKQNLVDVARNALVCDAQDAITKLRSLQSTTDEEGSTSRSDGDDEDDDGDGFL